MYAYLLLLLLQISEGGKGSIFQEIFYTFFLAKFHWFFIGLGNSALIPNPVDATFSLKSSNEKSSGFFYFHYSSVLLSIG